MPKKKKKRDFSGMVYSTDPDYDLDAFDAVDEEDTLAPQHQNLRIKLERYKGNKKASVVTGFIGTEADLKALGKLLKTKCGGGGSVKEGDIIIQGDHRQRIGEVLAAEGYKYKLSGG